MLSGGEQQVLALAPLLVHRPRVLDRRRALLGLAPQIVRQVMAVLTELRDDGVAVILVEEKSRDVLSIADRIVVLRLGRIVWSGRPDDLKDGDLAATYLGRGISLSGGPATTRTGRGAPTVSLEGLAGESLA